MSIDAPVLPETAPFSATQRAWLNGWLAAFCGVLSGAQAVAPPADASAASMPAPAEENLPWHDMALPLDERMALAEGRPLEQRLMAAMAQQDCGQCGYLCKTYAAAIAAGAEKALNRCVPGGKETARAVKALMELGAAAPAVPQPRPPPGVAAPHGKTSPVPARFEAALPLNRDGSAKDTRQVVLDLAGSGLAYEVGDALGVHAANCPETVTAIIALLGAQGA